MANKKRIAVIDHLSIVRHQRGMTGSDTLPGMEP
jgi:hypothetical protein